MSVLTPVKEESKVHHSEYIQSEDKPAEETKPAEESKPTVAFGGDEQAKPAEPAKPDATAE